MCDELGRKQSIIASDFLTASIIEKPFSNFCLEFIHNLFACICSFGAIGH